MAQLTLDQHESLNIQSDYQFNSLLTRRRIARLESDKNKAHATSLTRQIPLQLLASEWFSKIDPSTEMRAYLIENFLPILILGCEKVLKEAQSRDLITNNKSDDNFNPINHLSQYLMRNNPKYNNQNETSAYVRTMREVYQELKEQMFSIQGNKLAKVKDDVRKRRNEREQHEKFRQIEILRRKNSCEGLFSQFLLSNNGRLEIEIIQEAFKLYHDHILNLPEDMQQSVQLNLKALPSFCYERDGINLQKRILRHEFVECILSVTENLKSDVYDLFTEFFEQCAKHFINIANLYTLQKILKQLVKIIDSTNTGLLSRRRLIQLFENFKDKRADCNFRHPLNWPVLDPYIKFENKLEEVFPTILPKPSLEKEKPLKEKSIIEPNFSHNQPAQMTDHAAVDEKATVDENSTDIIETNLSETQNTDLNQTLDVDKSMEKIPDLDTALIENISAVDDAKIISSSKHQLDQPLKSYVNLNQNTNSKPSLSSGMNSLSNMERGKLVRPNITKDDELLFIKNGQLYYKPLQQQLNGFDKNLLEERKYNLEESEETSESSQDLNCVEFDPEFVNDKQFLNLINNYITPAFLDSEIYVNDLIVFIKDHYVESNFEKMSKLQKISSNKSDSARSHKYLMCFEKLDNEGSGFLSLNHISNAIQNYKDGIFKEQAIHATNEISQEILSSEIPDDNMNKDEFVKFLTILVDLVNFPKFEDQIINYLQNLTQHDYNEKIRGENRKVWLNQIKYVGEITYGSFEPLFKQLFLTLLKDSENHGHGKNISAYVGILERSNNNGVQLKYHATTPHDSKYLLGKTLSKETKNISFNAIDRAKMVHVPKVRDNQNVHYFNHNSKNDGSLVVLPLKFSRNKVFGTIGIDTLHELSRQNTFYDHELLFYQGVSNVFAKAYSNIIFKNRLIKTCISATEWLYDRCKIIDTCNIYFVQYIDNETKLNPDVINIQLPGVQRPSSGVEQVNPQKKYSLNLKLITKHQFTDSKLIKSEKLDKNIENRIGSKIYDCAYNSEATVDFFNGKLSFNMPIRNEDHKTVFIYEVICKENSINLDKYEDDLEQMETVFYVLHKCQEELLEERLFGTSQKIYEFETLYEQDKFEVLFEKMYLKHVYENLLNKFKNQQVVELMADGSHSPDTSLTKNLIKLISDLSKDETFEHDQIITDTLINSLKSVDSTKKNFNFVDSTSSFKLSKPESIKDLNKFHLSLARINNPIKYLIDWTCLVRNLKTKTDKLRPSK